MANGQRRVADLVPDLLPAVPPDRYTGNPLSYRLQDGRPLVYSVGPDQKDDAGIPMPDSGMPSTPEFLPASIAEQPEKIPGGDCILWPRPAEPSRARTRAHRSRPNQQHCRRKQLRPSQLRLSRRTNRRHRSADLPILWRTVEFNRLVEFSCAPACECGLACEPAENVQ